jgi:hypothetical protein
MRDWLRRFFYSDDEVVKFADGLSEFDAGQFQEILANGGVVAMKKNMSALYDRYWRPMLFFSNHFALFVKRSDVERARELLGPMINRYETRASRRLRRPRRVRSRD